MASKLNSSPKIWKLAHDLGVRSSVNPVSDIVALCEKKVKKFLKHFPECDTLHGLLEWVAGQLGTTFVEINSDRDLDDVKAQYIKVGEKIFASLESWLSDDVGGITIKRTTAEPWEKQYVSIIDCRGGKARKAYFTKWHELAHLLILTDQMRLCFKRTLHLSEKDPEEVLVDIIAGRFGFYPPLILQHAGKNISFDGIETAKGTLCPDASFQATYIGFVKAWQKPCMLLQCRPAFKKHQSGHPFQVAFSFNELPRPELRAISVTTNEAAREIGLNIYRNMRVPKDSVIYSVFSGEHDFLKAYEDLSWWTTSDGTILNQTKVLVQSKRVGDDVYALITLA